MMKYLLQTCFCNNLPKQSMMMLNCDMMNMSKDKCCGASNAILHDIRKTLDVCRLTRI